MLRLFSTLTTFGTALDIALQELRIESFFPADEATRDVLTSWVRRVFVPEQIPFKRTSS
ncbi:MAG TPA: hypothetical protein VIX11_04515 [Candidatus Acidoferrum sp.]